MLQSLNRYAYALNNPTTLTDPLGLDSIHPTGSGPHGLRSLQLQGHRAASALRLWTDL
jgi:hypothetical protein